MKKIILISISIAVLFFTAAWTNAFRTQTGYGPELYPNGDGSADGLTKGTGWSYNAVDLDWDCDGSQVTTSFLTGASVPLGTTILIKFRVTAISAGTVRARYSSKIRVATGYYEEVVTTDGTNPTGIAADSNFVGTIDDISMKALD